MYVYDGWNVIAEYTTLDFQTFDFQAFDFRRSYLFGLDLSGSMQGAWGVGGLLSVKIHHSTSNISYYPCYDGNGNVTEYLDSTGAVIAHFEYDPFGNTVVNTDTAGLFNYKFSSKPLDSKTGLYYYGYRYFDPLTGRWPSRDPIAERGGVNLYGFVHNRSTGRVDKLGLICTQLSFKWTTEPSPSSTKVEFESPAGGLMNAKRFTLYWSGVAEVRCCCEGNNFTKTGVMIGSYEVDVGGDNLFITGGNPMPMEVSAPTALGEAVAEIIGELIGGLGDLPSSSPSEINDLKIGLADVYDKWKFETPKNFILKDGWPCKKK